MIIDFLVVVVTVHVVVAFMALAVLIIFTIVVVAFALVIRVVNVVNVVNVVALLSATFSFSPVPVKFLQSRNSDFDAEQLKASSNAFATNLNR